MLRARYKLSDKPKSDDIISTNIFKRRDKIYYNIRNFFTQTLNNGVFAENILRLTLDGVNLNHLSKNHPHVDIAIVNEIPNFARRNEIISVKSSISKKPSLAQLISHTKSIKLFSMFSYVLFANSNYELNFEKDFFRSKELLESGIETLKDLDNKDWKSLVNVTMFYLMKKNKQQYVDNYYEDILKIGSGEYDLTFGNYNTAYRIPVLRRLVHLDAPISLGAIYLKEEKGDVVCHIHKTNPIKLNKYWEKLVDIWLDQEFFGKEDVKYLNLKLVKELFGIDDGDSFPIEFQISIGTYSPEKPDFADKTERERVEIAKAKSQQRTNKLYVATKFKDANFKDKEEDVNKFFTKSIDILEEDPKLIKKFNNFIDLIENPPKLKKWW